MKQVLLKNERYVLNTVGKKGNNDHGKEKSLNISLLFFFENGYGICDQIWTET